MSGLACGIVGLPNVGKSTLFNAVTSNQVAASNYPFCTIDPNVGVVEVQDSRLPILSDLSHSRKIVYATTQFVDIAGLVQGASKGEGLGNQFLTHIRDTDAIVHVVRCFDTADVIHVAGKVDPIDDIAVINLELCLSDLQMVENSLERLAKQAKSSKEVGLVCEVLQKVKTHLDKNLPVRTLSLLPEEKERLAPYHFITQKPVLYVCNVDEKDLPSMNNGYVEKVKAFAKKEGSLVVPLCAKIEAEIAQLPPEERVEFLKDLGLEESGLQRVIKASFDMLGLITFLTTGEIETRAWTITQGMTAQEAAGKIHTDIQKGFIRAEVVSYEDLIRYKGRVGAREAGKARSEGRDYIMNDGDVVLFMHN